jgi:hypothetical protein
MKDLQIYPIPKPTFEALMKHQHAHSVTVYMPMFKGGKEQNENMGQASLKECIREAQELLKAYQIHESEIKDYLRPIQELVSDIELWRNPAEGLAIFLDKENGMAFYKLPIAFDKQVYVANSFYVQPLFPLFSGDGRYYLLALSQDYVKLYQGSRYFFEEVVDEEITPKRLEEAVGYDYEEKQIQVRSGHAAHRAGSFHGYGEGKDDEKKELVSYFRQIDTELLKRLKNTSAPLVISCVDKLYPLYSQVNTYPNLYKKNVSGDPEFKDETVLHQDSWELVGGEFSKIKKEKMHQFTEHSHTTKTSYQLSEIIRAANDGKIDTLFVNNDVAAFGTYDLTTQCLILDETKEVQNVSLTNMAAVKTMMNKGHVYVVENSEMPVKNKSLNALMRF